MAPSDTDAEQNVAKMKRIVYEVQEAGNFALIDEFTHPEFFNHTAEAGLPTDRSGVHAVMRYLHSVFSNIKMEIVHCVSQGNVISTHKILRGNQTGEFRGEAGDGKRKQLRIMDVVTVVDGMMKEHWSVLSKLEAVDE